MITVAEATAHLLSLVAPLPSETVPLRAAAGRVLSHSVTARAAQPPFAASAMDGYAIADAAPATAGRFRVIGEAAAGHPFAGRIGAGEAVRIFTGAPVPEGGTRVLIQEDVSRDGDTITLGPDADAGPHIRPAGVTSRRARPLPRPADSAAVTSPCWPPWATPNFPSSAAPPLQS